MLMPFKKEIDRDLFKFHFVSGHATDKPATEYQSLSSAENTVLNLFVSFANFMTAQHEKFVVLRHSPDADRLFGKHSFRTPYRYLVLADDFHGNGVDRNFVRDEDHYAAYELDDLQDILELPEEVFEEPNSNISIFGLRSNSYQRLYDFLTRDKTPSLHEILSGDEVFINFVCGKEYGFFNSFLVKSKKDVSDVMEEFKMITEAGN